VVSNDLAAGSGNASRRATDGGARVVILSTEHVRELNTSRILQTLRESGPLSRAQLAAISGVRRGTIGAITKRLIDVNILEERQGSSEGKSGRPAIPLWFGSRAGLAGAIAIRHDELDMAIVNARGDILMRNVVAFDPDAVADVIDRTVVALFRKTSKDFRDEIVKIGVSVPGMCDQTSGEVTACPQVPGLVGSHLSEALEADTGVGTIVDDDSHGSALGEQWFGVGRGHPSFVTIQTGFGIGAAIVIDGTIIRGPAGLSTEVGHTCVDRFGTVCSCGLRGCWETIASVRWLREAAAECGLNDAGTITIATVAQLARAGNGSALKLIEQYAENVSVGLANLAQTLCIRRFILQGDAIQGGEELRRQIAVATQRRVFKSRHSNVTVELSQMADRAGVFGAAAIALAKALPVRA
jgi:predicted NBD/HSP70 family sugar kinase